MRNSTTYKISGTKTFRLASAQILPKKRLVADKVVVKGWGSNLQNIEKSMRQMYIPDEGKIFVQSDQAGAEALIVAYMTHDGRYRSLFKNGIKPHTYICLHLFKDIWPTKLQDVRLNMDEIIKTAIPDLKKNPVWKPLDACIKDSDNWPINERYYFLGKQTEHSSNYDVQPPMFRMNILEKSGGKIFITKEQSEYFIRTKHQLYPEIKEEFHASVKRAAIRDRMLYNFHGHPYIITQSEIRESDWKEYYSWIPQSTVAEITRKAYIQMQSFIEFESLQWDNLADTHDSLMTQCPIGQEIVCGQKQREFLCQSFASPFDGEEFSMKSETSAGYNWRPYHPTKNPTGLKEIK